MRNNRTICFIHCRMLMLSLVDCQKFHRAANVKLINLYFLNRMRNLTHMQAKLNL